LTPVTTTFPTFNTDSGSLFFDYPSIFNELRAALARHVFGTPVALTQIGDGGDLEGEEWTVQLCSPMR